MSAPEPVASVSASDIVEDVSSSAFALAITRVQPIRKDLLARAIYQGLNGHEAGPKAELHLAALPHAKGDRTLLGQVWTNLLANAVKFSSKRDHPMVEVSAVTDDKEHIYFVRDNGAGFDPRYQSKLFGVFQRLHSNSDFPGTGVGLALVQRIVTRHGGRVWADGRLNEGATFYFTLPKEQTHGTV